MKSTIKRITSLLLVFCLLSTLTVTTMPTSTTIVEAAQTKTITVGKHKVKILSKQKKTVEYVGTKSKKATITIPDTVKVKGKTYRVTKVGNYALANNKKVKTINVGKNVTVIGKGAFQNCTKLKTVVLQSKNLKKIGANAFENDKKLTKVVVNSTKLKTVGDNALKGTNAKLKIEVPENKTTIYTKLFDDKGNTKTIVKEHTHKWERVYGTRMEQQYAEDGTTNDYSKPIYENKWVEGETHTFDYAITPEMWNAKYGANCTDKLKIYETHRATNQYVTQTVHDLFPEHYPTVGALAPIDVYILVDKYNELNGTDWEWRHTTYGENSCEQCDFDSLPYEYNPEEVFCERCLAQVKFIRWFVNDCGIPNPAIVRTVSYQVISGYKTQGHYEKVIVGYEQLPEIEVKYVKYYKCYCGSTAKEIN